MNYLTNWILGIIVVIGAIFCVGLDIYDYLDTLDNKILKEQVDADSGRVKTLLDK